MIERIGNNSGDDIRNQLCPHDAVETEEAIHQEEKRNIYHALTKGGQDQGFLAHTHGLEGEGDLQIKEHQRNCEAEDTKEVGRHGYGLLVAVKYTCNLGCEELEEQYACACENESRISCGTCDGTHSLMVARGEVVGNEGHHTLAEAEANVHGKHIDLLRNTDCRHGHVTVKGAVSRRQVIDHDI